MATWTTPITWTTGQLVTAAQANAHWRDNMLEVWHEVETVDITSDVSITASTDGTANTVATASAHSFDGSTLVLIEFYCPQTDNNGGASGGGVVVLYDGSSSIGNLGVYQTFPSSDGPAMHMVRRYTPSNASHTYSIRAYKTDSNNQTLKFGGGGSGNFMPGYLRILQKG
jgi:hypothetical protein